LQQASHRPEVEHPHALITQVKERVPGAFTNKKS
jgi:hypothetical protein